MTILLTSILSGVGTGTQIASKSVARFVSGLDGWIRSDPKKSSVRESGIPRTQLAAMAKASTELSPRDRVINTKSADWKKGSEVWTGIGATHV